MASNKKSKTPGDDQFAFMERGSDTTANPPKDNIYHVSDQVLAAHDVYPRHMPQHLRDRKNNRDAIQIRFKETQADRGRLF